MSRREKNRLRRETEESDARSLNWAIASMFILKLCYIDWPDIENITDVGVLL